MTIRPRNPAFTLPSYAVAPWAPVERYPDDPPPLDPPYVTAETIAHWSSWAGLPTKTAHPGQWSCGLIPKSALPAQVINYILHELSTVQQATKTHQEQSVNEQNAFWSNVLEYIGQVPALGHLELITTTNVELVKYNAAKATWYAASASVNDKFQRTDDYDAWPGTTELSGGLLMGAAISDFAVNDLGHILAVANTADIYLENNGTTWTRYVSTLGKTPSGAPRCVSVNYAPTSGTWTIIFNPTVSQPPQVFYGTDRVFWTSTTIASFPNGTEVRVGCDGANGLVAMGRKAASSNVYFSKSDDGGATWSAAVTIDTGITADFFLPLVTPVWTGLEWVAIVTGDGAFPETKTYVSADGLSWAQTGYMSASQIQALACTGDCWLATLTSGKLVVSIDRGFTWRYLDRRFGAFTLRHVYFSGTRFVISGNGGAILVPRGAAGIGGAQAT